MSENYAPVCIIAYNRADKIKKVIESLAKNHLANKTRVYVFSDAPRDSKAALGVKEVREYLHSLRVANVDNFESNKITESTSLDSKNLQNLESNLSNLDSIKTDSKDSKNLQNLDSKTSQDSNEITESKNEDSINKNLDSKKLENIESGFYENTESIKITESNSKDSINNNLNSKNLQNIESNLSNLDSIKTDSKDSKKLQNLDSKTSQDSNEITESKNEDSINKNLDSKKLENIESGFYENTESNSKDSTNNNLNSKNLQNIESNLSNLDSKIAQNSNENIESIKVTESTNKNYKNSINNNLDSTNILPFKSIEIIEAEHNLGIKDSIVKYADFIFKNKGYECFIGLEDDIETHENFLQFMNDALQFYKDNPRIMAITAFSHQSANLKSRTIRHYSEDVLFTYAFHSWGWGTWRDRWEGIDWVRAQGYAWFVLNPYHLVRGNILSWFHLFALPRSQKRGRVSNLWDIYLSYMAYKQNRLCVWPSRRSYTRNFGFDGSGVHTFNFDANIVNFDFDNPPRHLRFTNKMNLGLWFNFKLSMLYGVDVWVFGFFKMFAKKIAGVFGNRVRI